MGFFPGGVSWFLAEANLLRVVFPVSLWFWSLSGLRHPCVIRTFYRFGCATDHINKLFGNSARIRSGSIYNSRPSYLAAYPSLVRSTSTTSSGHIIWPRLKRIRRGVSSNSSSRRDNNSSPTSLWTGKAKSPRSMMCPSTHFILW